jgi:hypothetical protein
MISFLRNRAQQGLGKKPIEVRPQIVPAQGPPQPPAANPADGSPPSPRAEPLAPPSSPIETAESAEAAAETIGAAAEAIGPVADALAGDAEPDPQRYEARQAEDGWTVYDRVTADTAEVYGYRLVKMNRARADSLVEVLNRGEARRRGRNG